MVSGNAKNSLKSAAITLLAEGVSNPELRGGKIQRFLFLPCIILSHPLNHIVGER
jgi:hypothetical protein